MDDTTRLNLANRDAMLRLLREELVGPAPAGPEIEVGMQVVTLESPNALYGPYRNSANGDEILTRDSPSKRYGVGLLHPLGFGRETQDPADELAAIPDLEDAVRKNDRPRAEPRLVGRDDAGEEFDLSSANELKPSSMGISLLACLAQGRTLVVTATGGRYESQKAQVREGSRDRKWWVRVPVEIRAEFDGVAILEGGSRRLVAAQSGGTRGTRFEGRGLGELKICVEVFTRPREDGSSLVTVCLVNRTDNPGRGAMDELTLFQSHFSVTVEGILGEESIWPYPTPENRQDPEQASLNLLYRDHLVFGTGHGCAADWGRVPGKERAKWVSAETLPAVRLSTVTPDIRVQQGHEEIALTVSMRSLTTLAPDDEGWRQLERIVREYERWISRQRERLSQEEFDRYRQVGEEHLEVCGNAVERMHRGLGYLRSNKTALRAFQLANEAVLLQQIAASRERRDVSYDQSEHRFRVSPPYVAPEESDLPKGRGNWRAFQIAFLLSSVESTGNMDSQDRQLVDLIWFPTGGGKTEAYLGLAAYSMFKRRLEYPNDTGVHVLMRYTLRLLTAQQFERAASLVCAMEHLRRRNGIGGSGRDEEFSIGIWLGGETTPNRRKDALLRLEEFERAESGNPFVILRCPWCAAEFKLLSQKRAKRKTPTIAGYKRIESMCLGKDTIGFKCPDSSCEFHRGLPVWIVDEDIYDIRPTMVIATIDKFAQLAWSSEPRALFGLDDAGARVVSPPGLIIQDELHLISGPLGSLAGLLEPVIEDLCTDRRNERVIAPKIVSSTATIRRYKEQVRALYGRDRVELFPPPGLDASDSFFAVQDKEQIGPMYVGVHAPSFMSFQTEWVRALSALVQAPMQFDATQRDPWWTMLMYCNSLRDMGTAHTLLDSDVRAYSEVIWARAGTKQESRRYLERPIKELTGGLQRSEVVRAIEELSVPVTSKDEAVDVCLASNIIEVGIDIQRLSMMVVAGQPKTTSQYIQVTGRVGRDRTRPGLIVTLYGPSKPRDRSHFERFRSYHERLYGQVEPTSLTPFSEPSLERELHAVLVSYVRQWGDQRVAMSPHPFPAELVARAASLLRARARIVDRDGEGGLHRWLETREKQWQRWGRERWDNRTGGDADVPLLRSAAEYATPEEKHLSWGTMTSMRNVDAECLGEITSRYRQDGNPWVESE